MDQFLVPVGAKEVVAMGCQAPKYPTTLPPSPSVPSSEVRCFLPMKCYWRFHCVAVDTSLALSQILAVMEFKSIYRRLMRSFLVQQRLENADTRFAKSQEIRLDDDTAINIRHFLSSKPSTT